MRISVRCPGLGQITLLPYLAANINWQRLIVLVLVLTAVCCVITIAVIEMTASSQPHQWQTVNKKHPRFPVAVATDINDPTLHFGVVIDCGSSGSRVYVYYWPPHPGNPQELLDLSHIRDKDGNIVAKKIEPGISAYADTPSEANEYLRPLLRYAAEHIPKEKHKETPLYIMATAGVRLLDPRQQEALLDDIRVDVPLETDFLFQDTHAEIISGKMEGIYAWIAINYILGNFDHQQQADDDALTIVNVASEGEPHLRKRTVGILDMGGGSSQIAFEALNGEDVPNSQLAEVNLGCKASDNTHKYRVYVTTFLGYGANTARHRYEEMMIESSLSSVIGNVSSQSMTGLSKDYPIQDPCLPVGMPDIVDYQGSSIHLQGTGNLALCQERVLPLLNISTPCLKEPCSFNGVFQPEINFLHSQFYGFSEYYYTTEDILRISGAYDYYKFFKAAQEYCGTDWTTLKRWYDDKLYPKADENRFRLQCFKSAWISMLLHEGHHFPKTYKHLNTARLVNGDEVQWTLGALLYKTRYYPLSEIQSHHSSHSQPLWWQLGRLHSATYMLMTCCGIAAIAICIYISRLRIVHRSDLRKIPSMGYFMTEENQSQDGVLVRNMFLA